MQIMTADEIYARALENVSPLPCQETYLRDLCAIIAFHMKKQVLMDMGFSASELPYHSAIVIAPTGTGKTHLLREVASTLDLNTIVLDCSSLSRDGWKGASFGQQLLAAKQSAKNDQAFERSLVFLDEIDKTKLYNTYQDQGNVQDNILQLFNGGVVSVEASDRSIEQLDVSRFTIIFGGAFSGLEKIIRQRLTPQKAIGFSTGYAEKPLTDAELMKHATIADVEKYGIKRELLGRIGTIVSIDPFEESDYRVLLTSAQGSMSARYRDYFMNTCGVSFEITDSAVSIIAQKSKDSGTGARAINPLINNALREAITMVDRDATICGVILDANEDSCFVRYEYGKRLPVSFNQSLKYSKHYQLETESIDELIDTLCEYYRKQPHAYYETELRAFMELSLKYLRRFSLQKDFCLESLAKLALATQKSCPEHRSPFDVIISDVMKKPAQSKMFEDMYRRFNCHWTPDLTRKLCRAITNIRTQFEIEHQCSMVDFKLTSRAQELLDQM